MGLMKNLELCVDVNIHSYFYLEFNRKYFYKIFVTFFFYILNFFHFFEIKFVINFNSLFLIIIAIKSSKKLLNMIKK